MVHQIGSHVEGLRLASASYGVSPGVRMRKCEQCLAGRDNMCRSYGLIGAMCHGATRTRVKVPARNVRPIPARCLSSRLRPFLWSPSPPGICCSGLAELQPGEGGVDYGRGQRGGNMAIQMAKLAGARVLTTVGSEEKVAKAKDLGRTKSSSTAVSRSIQRVRELTSAVVWMW